jgi:3-dehydroquinate synthase
MTATVNVALGSRSYPIHIGPHILSGPEMRALASGRRIALVTNSTLAEIHAPAVMRLINDAGAKSEMVILPDGEAHKNLHSLELIFEALLAGGFDRRSCIFALGGGVVGDIAGFAAATYQRGIAFVQMPTTLLAQVDSSVGGKTAVNHARGKNMIGAFHQPIAVFADTSTLATLPERELVAGLAEVIKYGLIRDPEFLSWLEANLAALRRRDSDALCHAIQESCRNKAEVVARDEFESGERALLNLGHTFGHAIEAAAGFGTWLHGEAVGTGMLLAALLSHDLGHLSDADVDRIARLIRAAGLPAELPPIEAGRLLSFMAVDKKNEDGKLRLILLRSPGSAYVEGGLSAMQLRSFLECAPERLKRWA